MSSESNDLSLTDPAGVQSDANDSVTSTIFINIKEQQAKQEVSDIKAKISNIYNRISRVRDTHQTDDALVQDLDVCMNECIDVSYRCDNISTLVTRIKDEYDF